MQKYTKLDRSSSRKESVNLKEQSQTLSRYPYYYPSSGRSQNQLQSTLPRANTQDDYFEEVRQRTNTQRTLNEKCRVSPTRPRNITYQEGKQYHQSMQEYIKKLKEIKTTLQKQLVSLQKMLDQTSLNLDKMDQQYQKIKVRILDYTSRCLDSGFKRYKEKMPRWSKYEEVQKKGLQLLEEMEGFIQSQNVYWQSFKREENTIDFNVNLKQLANRTSHYSYMSKQIKKISQECQNRHPIIDEQKVKIFEESLFQLISF